MEVKQGQHSEGRPPGKTPAEDDNGKPPQFFTCHESPLLESLQVGCDLTTLYTHTTLNIQIYPISNQYQMTVKSLRILLVFKVSLNSNLVSFSTLSSTHEQESIFAGGNSELPLYISKLYTFKQAIQGILLPYYCQ